jgi:hypothetical protein
MKRRIPTTVLTLGVAALFAMPAFAQQSKHQGGGFVHGSGIPLGGGAELIAIEGVQKELKLTDEQASKAEAVALDVRKKHQGDFLKLKEFNARERLEKVAEIVRTITTETNKGLAAILKPEQMRRFRQIQLQQLGLMAFTEPDVRSKLKLTDDQVGRIRRINADSQSQRRELVQGGGGTREEMRMKGATLDKESMDEALAVLSAKQKRAWKDMTGKPFEVQFRGFPVVRRPNN